MQGPYAKPFTEFTHSSGPHGIHPSLVKPILKLYIEAPFNCQDKLLHPLV